MARFFLSVRNAPIIRIEFTEDVAESIKPSLIDWFGMAFLSAETKDGDLLIYEFEAQEDAINDLAERLERWNESRIAKIDIDLNLN